MRKHLLALPLLLALAACQNSGADTRPLVDGPMGPKYEADLAACQNLARQKSYTDEDTAINTGVGAGLGAIIGGVTGDWAGAGIGAGVGAAGGLGKSAIDKQNARGNIVKKCMAGRGHNVVD
jgi:uncharacterized protein YcfJ